MGLDLLDTPVRISWRFTPTSPLSRADLLRIAGRLAEGGVFFVYLDGRPLLHPNLLELLDTLANTGIRISLVSGGSPKELDVLHPGLPLAQLDMEIIDRNGLSRDVLGRTLKDLRACGYEPGLLLRPLATRLPLLSELLATARELGVSRVRLPNIPLDGEEAPRDPAELPSPKDLERLRQSLAPDCAAGLSFEIHDLFIWELFHGEDGAQRAEYGGCQAGNSLGHVDAAGNLYPCASWPGALGSLLEYSLAELWASPARFSVRAELERVPSGCRDCAGYDFCFGGCRGLSRSFDPHGDGRDPLCAGPRR
ncbi:SPASM domain-containing protein [Trichloromonas acetexigens]|uniref:SPASM domain-containing protein n=1 Tax=Trichloromonas acetexigens TaxID=38815 RepID=A0A550JH57_9BACT|nr:SPASM domain-containing protein [Desulfuromonas acetexigens]TRO82536.1 SPASM domain-containing protein [Desulfuromonas acetexigens]